MSSSYTLTPTHEEIAQRAHALWEERGRPEGQETDHWLEAERELQREREQREREPEVRPAPDTIPPVLGARARPPRTGSVKTGSKVLN